MSKSWFLTYSDEAALKHNKDDYSWQNPLGAIEAGLTHIFSGFIDDTNQIEIGDAVYIYGGGETRSDNGKNGLYAKGTVKKIIPDEDNGKKHKFAVITITERGTPLINAYDYNFKPYYLSAGRNKGCYELTLENDKDFLDFMDKEIEKFMEQKKT